MNDDRRKRMRSARERLEALLAEVDAMAEEERDYFDRMPEGIQASERGQRADVVSYGLEEAAEHIAEAITAISDAERA